ncbi:hypothetical protein S83_022406 [Arachis hypogaea]
MWVLTVCVLGLDIVQVNVNRFGPTLCCGSSLPLLLGLCKDDASKLNNKIVFLFSLHHILTRLYYTTPPRGSLTTQRRRSSPTSHHRLAVLFCFFARRCFLVLRISFATCAAFAPSIPARFAFPHHNRVPNPHCQEQNTRLKLMQLGSIFLLKKAPSVRLATQVMEDLCERYFGPLFELLSHDKLGAPEIVPDYPILSVDDLADQIAEVLNFFGVN